MPTYTIGTYQIGGLVDYSAATTTAVSSPLTLDTLGSCCCSSIEPIPVATTLYDKSKEFKESVEKVDKHVDELEQDLEYYNEEHKKQLTKNEELYNLCLELNRLIDVQQKEIAGLTAHVDNLESRLKAVGA